MRLNETESLAWIHSHQPNKKKPLQRAQFYRIKAKLKDVSDKRKFDLQKAGLWNQHLERIDQLETILKFSWQNYHRDNRATCKAAYIGFNYEYTTFAINLLLCKSRGN